MREQLLSDELRRDSAHGAVELPPPPMSDHGAGTQVALATGGGGGGEGTVQYGGNSLKYGPQGDEPRAITSPDLGYAVRQVKRGQLLEPSADYRLFGRLYPDQ